jgi:hypothetical protein
MGCRQVPANLALHLFVLHRPLVYTPAAQVTPKAAATSRATCITIDTQRRFGPLNLRQSQVSYFSLQRAAATAAAAKNAFKMANK